MPRDKMSVSFPANWDLKAANEAEKASNLSGLPEPIQGGPVLALSFPYGRPENFDVVLDHRLGLHSGWKGICGFSRRLRWWSRTLLFSSTPHKRPLPQPFQSIMISSSSKTQHYLLSICLKIPFHIAEVNFFNSLIAQYPSPQLEWECFMQATPLSCTKSGIK